MSAERAEALEKLADICEEVEANYFEDNCTHAEIWACCHNKVGKGHADNCWYKKIKDILANLPQ